MTETELKMVMELADKPIADLRKYLAGFGSETEPSQASADNFYHGWTRGKLMEWILDYEFNVYEDGELRNGH